SNNICVTKPTRTGAESSTAFHDPTATLLLGLLMTASASLHLSGAEALRAGVGKSCQQRLSQDQRSSLVERLVAVAALGREHTAGTARLTRAAGEQVASSRQPGLEDGRAGSRVTDAAWVAVVDEHSALLGSGIVRVR